MDIINRIKRKFKNLPKNTRIAGIVFISIIILGVIISVASNYDPNANDKNRNFVSRLKTMPAQTHETLLEPLRELQTQTLLPPTDEKAEGVKTGSNVTINYSGWVASNGQIFDTSFNHSGIGSTFVVGESELDGWNEGIIGMKPGEIRRIKIPSAKAYKNDLFKPVAPGTDVVFDIELISIN